MKTITFEFEEDYKETIKGSLMEKIAQFKENEAIAKKQTKKRIDELISLREGIIENLNSYIGEDIWKIEDSSRPTEYYPSMKRFHKKGNNLSAFGIKADTNIIWNNWKLYVQSPNEKIKLGDLSYYKPDLSVIEIYLVHDWLHPTIHKIEDLKDVHKHLEKDYLTHFTSE